MTGRHENGPVRDRGHNPVLQPFQKQAARTPLSGIRRGTSDLPGGEEPHSLGPLLCVAVCKMIDVEGLGWGVQTISPGETMPLECTEGVHAQRHFHSDEAH
jgi:hypothetical protein